MRRREQIYEARVWRPVIKEGKSLRAPTVARDYESDPLDDPMIGR